MGNTFKDSTENLYNETKRLRQLYNLSIDGYFILNKDFELFKKNKAFNEMFGEEVIKLEQLFSEPLVYKSLISLLRKEGKLINKQLRVKNEKETNTYVISISSYLNEVTDEHEYQGIIRDISKQKRIEEKAKIQEKIAITGKMARTIAHEIRNPLSNITLSISEIEAAVENNDLTMFYEIIKNSCTRINDIVTEFIQNTNPMEIKSEQLNIVKGLEKSLEACMDRIKISKIHLTKDFRTSNKIKGDIKQLIIVFNNLIINAIEALENTKNPTINIVAKDIENGIMISIRDNGSGMDHETKQNLFTSFFSKKRSGLEVGMAAISNILNAHNAHIEVESELNKGTNITIYFD